METIKFNNLEIDIRRAKVREVKSLIEDVSSKITEMANIFYNKAMDDEEMIDTITNLIIDNIEFFQGYILQFSPGLTEETFNDLEFLDAIKLVKEILLYNGIKGTVIKNFFQNFNQIASEETQKGFVKEIPKV